MASREWSRLHWNAAHNIELFHAFYTKFAYPVHMHDYYVIGLIEKGLQSFSHRGSKYETPPGGLILLNPGDAHTGEPANHAGFEYKAINLTVAHMREAAVELTGRHQDSPFFLRIRVDDHLLANCLRNLYASLLADTNTMETESLLLSAMSSLITRTAEIRHPLLSFGRERAAVRKAREYINACWWQKITLSALSEHVGLSRYYFLRVFCNEVGMPPHAYLDSIRISQAKKMLKQGMPPKEVAFEAGFSDQSHFANRFKRSVGVTPGFYFQEHRN